MARPIPHGPSADAAGSSRGSRTSPNCALAWMALSHEDPPRTMLLNRHHVDPCIQCMFGAAQQNAMDGTDVAIITPPCHRDVTVCRHAIVRGIEIHPPGTRAPNRAPGMRRIRPRQPRLD